MIARTTQSLLEKHDGPVSDGDPIVVDMGDTAVGMKWGALRGVWTTGRHQANDSELEIYFVSSMPRRFRAGGQTGTHEVRPGIDVTTRAMLEYSLRVADPSRVITQLAGSGAASDDDIRTWVSSQLLTAIQTVLGTSSLLGAVTDSETIAGPALDEVNGGLRDVGLEVTSIDSLSISIPDEDLAKLRAR